MLRTGAPKPSPGSRLALAVSVAVLLLSVQAASGRGRLSPSAASCRLRIHPTDGGRSIAHRTPRSAGWDSEFLAYETAMLEFDLLCAGEAPIAENTRIELHLPSGDLYRSLTMEMTRAEKTASRRRGLRFLGAARFPVRGTYVTQNQLFGRWSAKLCREMGSRELCDTGVSFELLEGL